MLCPWVKLKIRVLNSAFNILSIDLSSRNIGVTEYFFYVVDIGAIFEKMCRK